VSSWRRALDDETGFASSPGKCQEPGEGRMKVFQNVIKVLNILSIGTKASQAATTNTWMFVCLSLYIVALCFMSVVRLPVVASFAFQVVTR
jgi:hypothetical protein